MLPQNKTVNAIANATKGKDPGTKTEEIIAKMFKHYLSSLDTGH
jgi:hypothetical protein